MALDAHVMPLWRFKAGDISSPIEVSLGIKPDVIPLADIASFQIPWHQRFLSRLGIMTDDPETAKLRKRTGAVRDVGKLKAEIAKMTGTPIDWMDEGCIQYSQQFHEPVMMRAFAAWHDHQDEFPIFGNAPEDNYYKHPAWSLAKPDKRRFPTLVDHSLHNGYLLPVAFDGVYKVEPFMIHNHWKFYHFVASSHAMLLEVEDFIGILSEFEPSACPMENAASLKQIRWYATELRHMCNLSLEHRLPVIFHG